MAWHSVFLTCICLRVVENHKVSANALLVPLQPEAELGDSDSDAGSDANKVSKRKKKLESRLQIAELKQVPGSFSLCNDTRIHSDPCVGCLRRVKAQGCDTGPIIPTVPSIVRFSEVQHASQKVCVNPSNNMRHLDYQGLAASHGLSEGSHTSTCGMQVYLLHLYYIV